jgi:hypothetical protein
MPYAKIITKPMEDKMMAPLYMMPTASIMDRINIRWPADPVYHSRMDLACLHSWHPIVQAVFS